MLLKEHYVIAALTSVNKDLEVTNKVQEIRKTKKVLWLRLDGWKRRRKNKFGSESEDWS